MYFALINLFLSNEIKFCKLSIPCKIVLVYIIFCQYRIKFSMLLGFCDDEISDFLSKFKISNSIVYLCLLQ